METPEVLQARRERDYWTYRIRSLESKLQTIDPDSQDFEDTVAAIFEAEDKVSKTGMAYYKALWKSQEESRYT